MKYQSGSLTHNSPTFPSTFLTSVRFVIPLCLWLLSSTAFSVSEEYQLLEKDLKGLSQDKKCESFNEFKAVLDFFREEKEFAVDEIHARLIAEKVSRGCTGAAKRFIRTFQVLTNSQVGGTMAKDMGILLSASSDEITENFLSIFALSFVKNSLDLSASKAVEMARKLSYDFSGSFENAKKDFNELAKFCKNESTALPIPACTNLIIDLVTAGGNYPNGVSNLFLTTYRYLRSEEGPQLPVSQAVTVARTLALISPFALENFQRTYAYAVSKEGLNFSKMAAVKLATEMAKRSIKPESEKK